MSMISTIGYEGADLAAFIATLKLAGIVHVLDVREVPVSRRKGYSKNVLRDALNAHGLRYSHFKTLGDPKDGREAMRRGDRETFRHIYSARLETADAQDALQAVVAIARSEFSVLLCYERDPRDCHRTMIAEKLVHKEAFSIRHLGVQAGRTKVRESGHGAGNYPAV